MRSALLVAAFAAALTWIVGPAFGEDEPPAVRLGAARAVLENALRLREVATLGERVAAVERALGLGTRQGAGSLNRAPQLVDRQGG